MYISDATSTSFFLISFEMSETVIILSKASSSILRSSFSTITLNFSGILACLLVSKKELMITNVNPIIMKITERMFGDVDKNRTKNTIIGIV